MEQDGQAKYDYKAQRFVSLKKKIYIYIFVTHKPMGTLRIKTVVKAFPMYTRFKLT